MEQKQKRSAFSGKIGFVLSAAGASVGLGNIWRFPYLAAKYGGGIFLLVYIVLAAHLWLHHDRGRDRAGPHDPQKPGQRLRVRLERGKNGFLGFGGWINAVIPVLIVPYYSVIGGWVIHYLSEYLRGNAQESGGGRLLSALSLPDGCVRRGLLSAVRALHAGHHLCGRAQRRGARLQG